MRGVGQHETQEAKMNTETGRIYVGDEVEVAKKRGEPIVEGPLPVLEGLRSLIQGNREYRRRMARLAAAEARRRAKG